MNIIPQHIPSDCSEKLSLRVQPWRRTIIEFCAKRNNSSLSQEIVKAIDLYFINDGRFNKWELLERSKQKYIQLELFNIS